MRGALLQQSEADVEAAAVAEEQDALAPELKPARGDHIRIAFDRAGWVPRFVAWAHDAAQKHEAHYRVGHEAAEDAGDEVGEIQRMDSMKWMFMARS